MTQIDNARLLLTAVAHTAPRSILVLTPGTACVMDTFRACEIPISGRDARALQAALGYPGVKSYTVEQALEIIEGRGNNDSRKISR